MFHVNCLIERLVAAILSVLSILGLTPPFIVGDSTAYLTVQEIGYGAAAPGRGYTAGVEGIVSDLPIVTNEVSHPLWAPPVNYKGPVVMLVSLWDSGQEDLTGYVEATQRYNDLGYSVIWVEVPEIDDSLALLNDRVEKLLGCKLADQRYREVELEDQVHPSPKGAIHMAYTLALLGEEHVCRP